MVIWDIVLIALLGICLVAAFLHHLSGWRPDIHGINIE